ncbi:hypothetical protein NUV33_09775 [Micrococcus luteus]|nr:hypothetical protein [Micrococcus luteus]MCR4489361.1 hypothetical protein [Micrococcus luteus]
MSTTTTTATPLTVPELIAAIRSISDEIRAIQADLAASNTKERDR